jgi:Tat protein translocase TatB subunit
MFKMFGIGFQELIIILVIALIIVGPKKLPEIAKTLGKGLAELRKASNDIKDLVNVDVDEEKHTPPKPYNMLDKGTSDIIKDEEKKPIITDSDTPEVCPPEKK